MKNIYFLNIDQKIKLNLEHIEGTTLFLVENTFKNIPTIKIRRLASSDIATY